MADSYPCPRCSAAVPADAGWADYPEAAPGTLAKEKTVRRARCPNCGEPLVRAAKHPKTPWHVDEKRDEEDEG
jgi:DNA-directed RNA polymerase subunit RPC12/RpoP